MVGGVFAVSRRLFDHPFFANEPFTEREAWVWLLADAAWKPRQVRGRHGVVELQRGQLAHSTRFMAAKWQWSEARVRRFLKRLKSDAMIDAQGDAQTTRITICKYNDYQKVSLPTDADNDAPSDRRSTRARRKEENIQSREEKEEPYGSSKKRGNRLPNDWQLAKDWADWAAGQGLSEFEIRREADKFRDYWHGIPGQRGVKLDWRVTWQNWVRKAVDTRQSRFGARPVRNAHGDLTNAFLFSRG